MNFKLPLQFWDSVRYHSGIMKWGTVIGMELPLPLCDQPPLAHGDFLLYSLGHCLHSIITLWSRVQQFTSDVESICSKTDLAFMLDTPPTLMILGEATLHSERRYVLPAQWGRWWSVAEGWVAEAGIDTERQR